MIAEHHRNPILEAMLARGTPTVTGEHMPTYNRYIVHAVAEVMIAESENDAKQRVLRPFQMQEIVQIDDRNIIAIEAPIGKRPVTGRAAVYDFLTQWEPDEETALQGMVDALIARFPQIVQ